MAMSKYGAGNTALTIGGISIEEFGDTDPPITVEDVEDRAQLKRGIGGTTLRLDNLTRPKTLTVNILPGSETARELIALEKTGVDFTFTLEVIGTGERIVGYDGVITNRGQVGRAGKTTVTDEQFTLVFGDSEET